MRIRLHPLPVLALAISVVAACTLLSSCGAPAAATDTPTAQAAQRASTVAQAAVAQTAAAPSTTPATATPSPTVTPSPSPSPTVGMPSGSLLERKILVTYYGNPYSTQMGILGQLDKPQLVAAVKKRAAEYQAAAGKPAQGALHFVATVAQAGPGDDGKYRARMPLELVTEYADLAAANDLLFFIDLQFGLSSVERELEPWLDLLKRPYVHLAMDPEFNMWEGLPGQQIGSMKAKEINYAQTKLAELVRAGGLPNKVLMVYQFTTGMLPDKENIAANPLVDVVINMDGFGGREAKTQNYELFVGRQGVEYAGIKLFLEHDVDLMGPADVMALEPQPHVVTYQ